MAPRHKLDPFSNVYCLHFLFTNITPLDDLQKMAPINGSDTTCKQMTNGSYSSIYQIHLYESGSDLIIGAIKKWL